MCDRPDSGSNESCDRPLLLLNLRLELLKLGNGQPSRLGDRLHGDSLLEEIERDRPYPALSSQAVRSAIVPKSSNASPSASSWVRERAVMLSLS
jgi:hypothetical protein